MDNLTFDFPEISQNEEFSLFDKLNSEDIKDMNFDQFRNKTYNTLSDLESEIIANLVSHDKEFFSMFKNFDETEQILEKLEYSLCDSKEKLSQINSEMKSLQTKSKDISVKLKNRKEFEESKITLFTIRLICVVGVYYLST